MDYHTNDNAREVQPAIYGRQNVTIFNLPSTAGRMLLYSTCHLRQAECYYIQPAIYGRQNVTIFNLPSTAGRMLLYSTCHLRQAECYYIQPAIYGRQNVTIFTAAVWHQRSYTSYSVVTNGDKYKNTVRMCMLRVLKGFLLNNDISDVEKFIIWSDGSSCEFRNKYSTGKLLFELSQLVKRDSYSLCSIRTFSRPRSS